MEVSRWRSSLSQCWNAGPQRNEPIQNPQYFAYYVIRKVDLNSTYKKSHPYLLSFHWYALDYILTWPTSTRGSGVWISQPLQPSKNADFTNSSKGPSTTICCFKNYFKTREVVPKQFTWASVISAEIFLLLGVILNLTREPQHLLSAPVFQEYPLICPSHLFSQLPALCCRGGQSRYSRRTSWDPNVHKHNHQCRRTKRNIHSNCLNSSLHYCKHSSKQLSFRKGFNRTKMLSWACT